MQVEPYQGASSVKEKFDIMETSLLVHAKLRVQVLDGKIIIYTAFFGQCY